MENSEPMRMQKGETRTSEQLRRHYEIERRLAAVLRNATAPERPGLYNKLYDELYRLAPDHPQLIHRLSEHKLEEARRNLEFLGRFLTSRTRFLEIGPGDCSLSFEVAHRVQEACAVDICETMSRRAETPANFRLVILDGRAVPVPPQSIDVAFSNQLMEHLHPDDAEAQLGGVYSALASGGIYICLTPNRLSEPHNNPDISIRWQQASTSRSTPFLNCATCFCVRGSRGSASTRRGAENMCRSIRCWRQPASRSWEYSPSACGRTWLGLCH